MFKPIVIVILFSVFAGPAIALVWRDAFGGYEYAYVLPDRGPNRTNVITWDQVKWYTWYDSEDVCMAGGGYLVSIETNEEAKFLRNILAGRTLGNDFVTYYWMGLNDLNRDNNWEWSDGKPDSLGIGPKGESNKYRYCGKVTFNWDKDVGEYVFHDRCVKSLSAFICKRKKGDESPKHRPPPVKVPGYCPQGWTDPGTNRCYKAFNNTEGAKWYLFFRDICRALPLFRPELACANTKEEIEALTRITSRCPKKTKFWFGLQSFYSDKDKMSQTTWNDGSRMNATNFHRYIQKDDDGYGYIDNAATPSGSWDFHNKNERMTSYYICQIEKDPDHIITEANTGADETPCSGTGGASGGIEPCKGPRCGSSAVSPALTLMLTIGALARILAVN